MCILTDIDDNLYTRLFDNGIEISNDDISAIATAIRKGIPLPKGPHKLVDIIKIDEDRIDGDNPIIYLTMNGECIEAVSLDYLNSLSIIV